MKLLVVISSLSGGGAGRVVSTLTREWSKSHRVLVALFDASHTVYGHGGAIVDLGVPSRPSNHLRRILNAASRSIRIARLIRRERPDRIVSFMESANYPAIVAAATTGSMHRLCVSVRCNPVMIPGLKRFLLPISYRLPRRVVAPSNGVQEALQKMGLPVKKLLVIPNPIADRRSRPITSPICAQRFILAVGRLVPVKGFDRLLNAFSGMERSDVHLVILGDGTQRAELLALSYELGIASRVHLPGVVLDVDTWYRHAECFVLTSRSEGSPNVLVEAMANGCPVVSFDCSYGPAEILQGGRSGLLVPQDDIAGLSHAIHRLITDRALRARLAKAGRQRAKSYSAATIASRWLSGFGS